MSDVDQSQQRKPVADGRLPADFPRLLPYITALELEVDSLRRRNHVVYQEVRAALTRVRERCAEVAESNGPGSPTADILRAADDVDQLLSDLKVPAGYHPAFDQVIAIALRPLAEQVFRWQQRLLGATEVTLRLDAESEYVEWFPARLRHILDNLFSNALKYRDPAKKESWVRLQLHTSADGYQLRITDNGLGMPPQDRNQLLDLFYRATLGRAAGLGVGLAVVKLLVEQSGGSLTVDSGEGQGTTFVAVLPRFDVTDYLL